MKFIEVPMLPIVIPLGIMTFLLLIRLLHSRGRVTVARASVAAALAIYAGGILANTVFPIFLRIGTGFYDGPRPVPLYLVPFVDYGLEDALINIAVFIPLGALIPLITTRPNWGKVLTIVASASLAIELAQMAIARLAMGGHLADINDWMTNILGGMIGYGLFTLLTLSKKVDTLAEHFRWPPRQTPGRTAPRFGNPPYRLWKRHRPSPAPSNTTPPPVTQAHAPFPPS